MSDERTTVEVTIIAFSRCSGPGGLIATADVGVVLDGVEISLHGLRIEKHGPMFRVAPPNYRDSSGAWRPSYRLPDDLDAGIGRLVVDELRARSAPIGGIT